MQSSRVKKISIKIQHNFWTADCVPQPPAQAVAAEIVEFIPTSK
jgi:hypothetical protein